jgi:hypothetical protein
MYLGENLEGGYKMKKVSVISLFVVFVLAVFASSIVTSSMMSNVTRRNRHAIREFSQEIAELIQDNDNFKEEVNKSLDEKAQETNWKLDKYREIYLEDATDVAQEEVIKLAGNVESVKLPSFTISYYHLGDEVIIKDIKQTSIKFAIKFEKGNVTGNEKIENELPYLCRDGSWIYQYSIYEGDRMLLKTLKGYLDQHR